MSRVVLKDKKDMNEIYQFDDMMDWYETPFPCNEFWDKKAWYWLEQNIEKFKGDILFWNLGGNW